MPNLLDVSVFVEKYYISKDCFGKMYYHVTHIIYMCIIYIFWLALIHHLTLENLFHIYNFLFQTRVFHISFSLHFNVDFNITLIRTNKLITINFHIEVISSNIEVTLPHHQYCFLYIQLQSEIPHLFYPYLTSN